MAIRKSPATIQRRRIHRVERAGVRFRAALSLPFSPDELHNFQTLGRFSPELIVRFCPQVHFGAVQPFLPVISSAPDDGGAGGPAGSHPADPSRLLGFMS